MYNDDKGGERTDMDQKDTQKKRNRIILPLSTVIFASCVIVVYIISNLPALSSWFDGLLSILAPVIGGLALAYLCNPILRFFENHPLRRIKSLYVKRTLSIFLTYFFFILIVAALGMLIVPQLIHSIKELFAKFDDYIANTVTYINQLLSSVMEHLPFGDGGEQAQEFLSLDKVNALFSTLIGSLSGLFDVFLKNISAYGSKLVSSVTNVILSLFISFYLLASKEKRLAQVKMLTAALFSEKHNRFIHETARLANKAFGNFIGGKILDSLIVGIVEYIVFSLFKIPYAPMLACIMCVTNVIPFFGPLIGAIPSAFIVFISDPSKLLTFIIITLIIQQVDGNIIEPKVLGDRTGVSSLCVIIAISVMGNLWGVFGMIIGVPLFAVVIALVEQLAKTRLSNKGLPIELDDYYHEEPHYVKALAQGKAKLSKRYYTDKLKHFFASKRRKGEPPRKEDYMIYPPMSDEQTMASDTSDMFQEPSDAVESLDPTVTDQDAQPDTAQDGARKQA